MPRDRVGHLWVLHSKSVPRNGLRERRDLESGADDPRALLPRRAVASQTPSRKLLCGTEPLGLERTEGSKFCVPFEEAPGCLRRRAGELREPFECGVHDPLGLGVEFKPHSRCSTLRLIRSDGSQSYDLQAPK